MHGLCLLAAEASPLSNTPNISEFRETLQTLTSNLNKALNPDSNPRHPSHRPLNMLVPTQSQTRKRFAPPNILPPSPEAKQRRKTSGSTM